MYLKAWFSFLKNIIQGLIIIYKILFLNLFLWNEYCLQFNYYSSTFFNTNASPVFYKNKTKILRSQLEFPFHGPDQYQMIAILSHFTQFQYLQGTYRELIGNLQRIYKEPPSGLPLTYPVLSPYLLRMRPLLSRTVSAADSHSQIIIC